jgi:hypothetical protein
VPLQQTQHEEERQPEWADTSQEPSSGPALASITVFHEGHSGLVGVVSRQSGLLSQGQEDTREGS